MKVIFHAGANKTGSTTIQGILDLNRERLAASGIFYPLLSPIVPSEHWALVALEDEVVDTGYVGQRLQRDGRADIKAQVMAELERNMKRAQACDGALVLSTESIGARATPMRVLREMAEAHGAKVEAMIYLRPYSDLFVSGVQHMLKAMEGPLIPPPMAHMIRIRALVSAFGRENVASRVFSRKALLGGDVVTDFHDWLGRKIGKPLPALDPVPNLNEAMAAECCALLVFLNLYNRHPEAKAEYQIVSGFLRRHAAQLPGTKVVVGDAMRARIARIGAEAWNEELAFIEGDPAVTAGFAIPLGDAPPEPFSEVEATAWIASHWQQSYLDAAIELASGEERQGKRVFNILNRVFKAEGARRRLTAES